MANKNRSERIMERLEKLRSSEKKILGNLSEPERAAFLFIHNEPEISAQQNAVNAIRNREKMGINVSGVKNKMLKMAKQMDERLKVKLEIPVLMIKKDLNMPHGKLCAQVSHAISLMILNLMTGDYEYRQISEANQEKLESWLEQGCPVQCVMIDTAAFNERLAAEPKGFTTVIEDHGRTVFNGQKTVTVAAMPYGFDVPPMTDGYIMAKEKPQTDDEKRQVFIVDTSSKNKIEDLISMTIVATVLCIMGHRADYCGYDFSLTHMAEWLDGGFAKIFLSTKDIERNKEALIGSDLSFIEISPHKDPEKAKMLCLLPYSREEAGNTTEGLRTL
ncbi:peptidyl-tRNA hydrolase [Aeromonas sp. MrichA-1]|uniref:peptidyl-tRNA hydrolase n=1 Tax=Aeromonas sp. MrichA-1 TaxID=2823362 RepID=UPI001B33F955|nr:peptidyl-tRNA hydrolase [Aeromonas sp. MrichA-1]MBP4081867.1 peptidyl-tRNA hydrolase [Aeromonas sp. MrichA-1]